MGSWCCVHFHGAHVALGAPGCTEMPMGALGLTMGLMEWGEGPNGHMGALGSVQGLGAPGLTHCISFGAWRDGEEEVLGWYPGGHGLPETWSWELSPPPCPSLSTSAEPNLRQHQNQQKQLLESPKHLLKGIKLGVT